MTDDLDRLKQKIDEAQESRKESPVAKGVSQGAEFIAPILGGLFIGYMLDDWLDTKPVFIIALFLLGVGAGFLNIYKASQNIGSSVGFSELHRRNSNAKTSADTENTESND